MFSSPASSSSDSEFSSSGSFLSAASSPDSSPASSTRSSPVHAASLVDPASHPRALMQLIDIKLDKHVIDYLVDAVAETVDFALGRTHTPPWAASPISRGRSTQSPYLQKFTSFVSTVLSRAEVTPATVLVSLVYISRARPHLSIALEEWALERVFLGSLIVASKYTNDSTLKNVHWALCTGVFGKRDIGRIEREFLDVLDWDLSITETDVMAHHEGLIAAATRSTALASRLIKTTPNTMTTTTYLAPPTPVRSRTHTRKHSAGAVVPELEPSSPLSSLASMSPRTPLSHGASSPSHHKDVEMMDVPMDVSPVPAPAKRGCGGKKYTDFIRSIPLPLPLPRSQHRGFPIHVGMGA
ncbi:cyclin N-terminal domain-containing protein [Favolaschia claudopus]|uniref:Cyclin N-terminal domain-containing protein n=1 Tax=Favolaschia claudopus TaxID=2862362 RepID=A0AAW0B0K6_9AGAR